MAVTINLNGVMPSYIREAMVDADKVFSAGTTELYTSVAFTAPRVATIPLASAVPAGRELIVYDQFGTVTSTNTLTITRAGSDTINGATAFVLSTTSGIVRLISNGVDGYTASVNSNSSGVNTGDETAVTIGAKMNTAAAKNPPIDADSVYISDSAASGALKKVTWTNVKAFLKTYFDGIYQATLSIASSAEITTGTDNAKYVTAAGLEGSKYLSQPMSKITATASGTDTYTASLTPAITAYSGIGLYINFTNANTVTNPTLAVNGLSADGFVQSDGTPIMLGALKGIVHIKHNGTAWQLVGPVVSYQRALTKDINTYNSTNTTAEELLAAIPVLSGIVIPGDFLELVALVTMATTSNNKNFRMYISPTASFADVNKVQLAFAGPFTNTSPSVYFRRKLIVVSDTVVKIWIPPTTNYYNDDQTNSAAILANYTVPSLSAGFYFFVTSQKVSGPDFTRLETFVCELIR